MSKFHVRWRIYDGVFALKNWQWIEWESYPETQVNPQNKSHNVACKTSYILYILKDAVVHERCEYYPYLANLLRHFTDEVNWTNRIPRRSNWTVQDCKLAVCSTETKYSTSNKSVDFFLSAEEQKPSGVKLSVSMDRNHNSIEESSIKNSPVLISYLGNYRIRMIISQMFLIPSVLCLALLSLNLVHPLLHLSASPLTYFVITYHKFISTKIYRIHFRRWEKKIGLKN